MRSRGSLVGALGAVAICLVQVGVAAPPPTSKVLELGGPAGRPSWLLPEGEEFPRWRFVNDGAQRWAVDPLLGFTWLLAWDERFLFVRTDRGALIESRADGVIGFVPPPLRFAVYDPAGFVVATRGEESLRAPIAHATELAAYVPFGVDGRVVDRAGTTWLAVVAGKLVRSGDGAAWEAAAPTTLAVRDARVRRDGTIVADTADGLVVVTPKGLVAPATLQLDQPSLVRWGDWIVAAAPFALAHPEAGLAVLGSDRKTWVTSKPPKDQAGAGLVQIVDNWLGYAARMGKGRWPGAAPTRAPTKRPVRGAASDLSDELVRMIGGGDSDTPPCRGSDCFGFKTSHLMSGDVIPRFFPDARCDSEAACDRGPYVRPPAIGVFDLRSGATRVLRAPAACQPVGVQAARGLVLLDCRTRLYALTAGGWSEELALVYPAGKWLSYALADDGTLIVIAVGKDERPHAAWLRQPVELGVAGAWREVTLPQALWYGPLTGGRAAVVTTQDTNHLNVWEVGGVDPALRQTPRATVELTGQLTNIRLVDRSILLTVGGKSQPVSVP